jgi:hypothetical protein
MGKREIKKPELDWKALLFFVFFSRVAFRGIRTEEKQKAG